MKTQFFIRTERNKEKLCKKKNCWSAQYKFPLEHIFVPKRIVVSKCRLVDYKRNEVRNIFGGGLWLYINEDIPSKQIRIKLIERLESMYIEVNLRKRKWLVIGIYKRPQSCSKIFVKRLSFHLNYLHTSYGDI